MSSAHVTARTLDGMLGDWRTAGPVYEALADRIRLLVLDGRVPMDARLPAERDLAGRLSLSRTTVTSAYRRLREGGFARSLHGSGTLTKLPAAGRAVHAPLGTGLLDFTKAAPPASRYLPDAVRDAANDLPAYLGDNGYDPIGLPALREAIAQRYALRGLPTDPDQILVTVGAQQAIALIARTLLSRGDRALVETPTYPHAHEVFAASGARLVTVPVATDSIDGWDMAALESAIRRTSPVLAYVMPDFQNPTGRTMSLDARRRLIDAAAAQGTIIVADETPAELNIDREGEFPPLAACADESADSAGSATIITIGSASKTIWGGLRIGWIRADHAVTRKLAAARAASDLGTPILEQLITARLIPQLDGILDERRATLAAGRASVEQTLMAQFPDWSVPHVNGGLAAWVNIGTPMSSQLALAARNQGLLITAGPRFGIDGAFERFLRVPITPGPDAVASAVEALARAWPGLARHPLPDPAYLTAVV